MTLITVERTIGSFYDFDFFFSSDIYKFTHKRTQTDSQQSIIWHHILHDRWITQITIIRACDAIIITILDGIKCDVVWGTKFIPDVRHTFFIFLYFHTHILCRAYNKDCNLMTTFLSVFVWSNSYRRWTNAWDVIKLSHFYGKDRAARSMDFLGSEWSEWSFFMIFHHLNLKMD